MVWLLSRIEQFRSGWLTISVLIFFFGKPHGTCTHLPADSGSPDTIRHDTGNHGALPGTLPTGSLALAYRVAMRALTTVSCARLITTLCGNRVYLLYPCEVEGALVLFIIKICIC